MTSEAAKEIAEKIVVGSSGLRIIKKGGVELIIPKPLLIKNYSSKDFTYFVKRIWSRRET